MDDAILITELNDFIFCPASIYFHRLYGSMDKLMYQSEDQLNGSAAHMSIDQGKYSTKAEVLMGTDVYSERFNLIGKIDIFDTKKGVLRERKKKIKVIYDGYIFQIYAQYFALVEMGYDVKHLELYSIDDNKTYPVTLPDQDKETFRRFVDTIDAMKTFHMDSFHQKNMEKCRRCIYEPACDRSLLEEELC